MMESENMQRLNQISSTVTERDMKIWENVAHSVLIQKEAEKLKTEITRMKSATGEKKKENKIIENQLLELTKTLSIQEQTLKTSEQSVVALTTFKESLQQEANDLKKKYAATLEMYNTEYEDYRGIYENASQIYKDLKAQQIEMKKLEIKKLMLDSKIGSLVKSQKQYKILQEQIFHKAMVRFAQFYLLYHKNAKLKTEVREKKQEEQQLLKEHLRLAEAVKQKKQMYRNKPRTVPNLTNQNEKSQITQPSKQSKEMPYDKLQKFLSEDFKPCSLTSLESSQRATNFSTDHPKVQILDVKTIRPPLRPTLCKKSNPELRKKMEDIMQAAKIEARRGNPSQPGKPKAAATPLGSPRRPSSQNKIITGSQSGSQSKLLQNVSQQLSKDAKGHEKKLSQTSQCEPPVKIPRMTPTADVKPPSASILKPSSQVNVEKPDNKQENVSKFFNPKKKSVKFQSQAEKPSTQDGSSQFQLFSKEENAASGAIVKNLDIFQKPIFFRNEAPQQHDKENTNLVFPMMTHSEEDVSGVLSNVSFTMETAPTTLSTFAGGELSENKKNEMTFDLTETSFGCGFVQAPLENAATESTTFDFFGSQSKTKNPFGFF